MKEETGGNNCNNISNSNANKKVRECSSPIRGEIMHRTPIKNNTTNTHVNVNGSPFLNDEDEEKRKNREELLKKKHDNLNSLMSPSAEASPRAEPPSSILSAKGKSHSNLSNSTSIESLHSSHSPLNISNNNLRNPHNLSKSISGSKLNNSVSSSVSGSGSGSASSVKKIMKTPQSVEEMSKSFEEWMKMAADNKINSKNSWNFALIDYFSELTFLKEGDSINFQKASCTLDGCVKIYSSRVDSVVDETTKLLNGLSDKKYAQQSNDQQEGGLEGVVGVGYGDDDNDDEDNNKTKSTSITGKTTKRSSSRSIETIEKNPENLTLKNFELEFSIDPLFKKTSAEFDESGSRGSLLKTLQMSPIDNLIIFDSSDQISMDFNQNFSNFNTTQDDDFIDISDLNISTANLIDKLISPTFENYNLSSSASSSSVTSELLEKLSNLPMIIEERTQTHHTHMNNNDNVFMDMDMGGFDEDNYQDDPVDGDESLGLGQFYDEVLEREEEEEEVVGESSNTSNSRVVEEEARRYSVLTNNLKWNHQDQEGGVSGLSYFDGAFKETWAGPEHWKIRRSQRIPNNPTSTSNCTTTQISTSRKTAAKQEKKAAIDFMTTVVDFRQIFSKPTTASQITLTKAAILERNEQNHLLPEDLHFTSSKLLKLFIKPTWTISSARGRGARESGVRDRDADRNDGVNVSSVEGADRRNTLADDFVDRNYWLSQETRSNGIQDPNAADTAPPNENDYDDMDDYYEDVDIPMNPITNNNNINPNNNPAEIDFNKQMVAAPKFILAPQLNYARVAKRVDIAKLKATLWQEFLENNHEKSTVGGGSPIKTSVSTNTKEVRPLESQSQANNSSSSSSNTFSNLINNLSKSYPTDALADLSVPYCFICLLHLANENNLEIQETESDLLILN